MKKEYKKPEIFIEDFNICQNIASGCYKTEGANHHQGGCTIDTSVEDEWGDLVPAFLFNTSLGTCTQFVNANDCQDGSNGYGGYFFS